MTVEEVLLPKWKTLLRKISDAPLFLASSLNVETDIALPFGLRIFLRRRRSSRSSYSPAPSVQQVHVWKRRFLCSVLRLATASEDRFLPAKIVRINPSCTARL